MRFDKFLKMAVMIAGIWLALAACGQPAVESATPVSTQPVEKTATLSPTMTPPPTITATPLPIETPLPTATMSPTAAVPTAEVKKAETLSVTIDGVAQTLTVKEVDGVKTLVDAAGKEVAEIDPEMGLMMVSEVKAKNFEVYGGSVKVLTGVSQREMIDVSGYQDQMGWFLTVLTRVKSLNVKEIPTSYGTGPDVNEVILKVGRGSEFDPAKHPNYMAVSYEGLGSFFVVPAVRSGDKIELKVWYYDLNQMREMYKSSPTVTDGTIMAGVFKNTLHAIQIMDAKKLTGAVEYTWDQFGKSGVPGVQMGSGGLELVPVVVNP